MHMCMHVCAHAFMHAAHVYVCACGVRDGGSKYTGPVQGRWKHASAGGVKCISSAGLGVTNLMVHSAGGMPRSMAAFSAGRPKASQPIGCTT